MQKTVVLASASPRRQELLARICKNFVVESADIDETPKDNEAPETLVVRLALEKAKCVFNKHRSAVVIGSDTVIAFNNAVLGKPKDKADFMRMMSLLSDKTHRVLTAVACVTDSQQKTVLVETRVTFCEISEQDAIDYWNTGEPKDKAGGYAIQGLAEQFVKHIQGSFSSVVGLPLYETKQLVKSVI
uniref:Maf family protein n=1 Tax=Ningiella ruwaisensis TaxID=2364274 RepID=UPI00109F9C6B|nr:Maf family protein [Ningiella ruwaisensis]